jgi:hypothetical protein
MTHPPCLYYWGGASLPCTYSCCSGGFDIPGHCCVPSWTTSLVDTVGCDCDVHWLCLDVTTGLSNVTLAGDALGRGHFLQDGVSWRPSWFYDGTLLLCLKMFCTEGRMVTDMRSTPGGLTYCCLNGSVLFYSLSHGRFFWIRSIQLRECSGGR